jgi:23S rRNA U2552 (ribose-2'-O)-methylase RlmE/FtsJ
VSRRGNPYARPDARTRSAKDAGYPARSVYKLQEIDKRVRLLRPGQRVLDLGAAPGSWSLYASERVGAGGRVLAVDLAPIAQPFAANVEVVTGDALSLATDELARFAPYDVVLSDMAPNTSGSKVRDQALSFELFMRAVELRRQAVHERGLPRRPRVIGRALRQGPGDPPREHAATELRGVSGGDGAEGGVRRTFA